MLRPLAAALVIANLLFWGWSSGWLGDGEDTANGTDDGNRIRRQIAPERMRILAPGEGPSASGAAASSP